MKQGRRWLAVVVGAFFLPPAVDDPLAEEELCFGRALEMAAANGELGEAQCLAPGQQLVGLRGRQKVRSVGAREGECWLMGE